MPKMRILLRWQIFAGFGVMLAIILLLGAVARYQTGRLWTATRIMHDHPLQVRDAVHQMHRAVLVIRQSSRDLALNPGPDAEKLARHSIEKEMDVLEKCLAVFEQRYLGPRADLEGLRGHLREWNTLREQFLTMIHAGKVDDAALWLKPGTGILALKADRLIESLDRIETFAIGKGAALRRDASATYSRLNQQMLIILVTVLILSLFTILTVLRNFRRSLGGLLDATHAFSDTTPVHAPVAPNEFGELAIQYNHLVDRVTGELNQRRNIAELNRVFVDTSDARSCATKLLSSLAGYTGASTGAVLLTDKSGTLIPAASIGLDASALAPIDPASDAGDFGLAKAGGGFMHLTDLPPSGPHVLPTVHGLVFPRELVTLVPQFEGKPLALLSLGTLKTFEPEMCEHLKSLLEPLSTGLLAIFARERLKDTTDELRSKNIELERQTQELDSQNMELELQAMQLQEMNRVKTAFFSNMSHELRTPLNSVIALSGVLSRRLSGQIPEEEIGYLSIIERNGRQLLGLINDVLDLARLESGREEVHLEEFDVVPPLAEMVQLLRPLAEEKGLSLTFEALPRITILSDRSMLVRIVQNLLGNAIKFTQAGSVSIMTQEQPEFLEIKVRDTGIGIPADQLQVIFEEFRQAEHARARGLQGSGLGLSIARRSALLLGGTLTVESTVGEGSEFTLRLPKRHAVQEETIESTEYFGPTGHGGNRLLLIEDNEAAVIQIQDLFAPPEFSLRVANNGLDGLAAIRNEVPDAIILDLNMPGIDGFGVLKALREEPGAAHVPVLILTARHVSKEELSFLKENGIFQLIQKGGVRRDELLDTIHRMLGTAHPVNNDAFKAEKTP
ncbi:MAG: hypothetical protein CVU59_10060 [Deltaproteobacteria bacterium HGW-Deltaproteobacteria-17]|nr:MAG: hypothetical protein CVU59_10060 [Deltaproteobacteria bacterium HGW-Deltaproteobacteria-17]